MTIAQPTYPITTADLVTHIGGYADTKGAAALDYVNVQRDHASDVAAAYAAAPAGSTLYCPKGTYNVWTTAALALGSKAVRFVGDGNGATVWQGPSSRYGITISGTTSSFASRVLLTADALRSPASGTGYLPKLTLTAGGVTSLGIAAGDYVLVGSTALWPETGQSNTRGEIARVFAVDAAANQIQLMSMLADTYTVAQGAYVRKVTPSAKTIIEGIDFQNTTPQTGTEGFVFMDGSGPGCELRHFEMRDCDSRGVLAWNAIGAKIHHGHFKDFKGTPGGSTVYNTYGVSMFQATQWCEIADCTADNIWEMVTTNGSANEGVPRYNVVKDCAVRNPFSAGFGMHEEGQHNHYRNLSVFGGHEKASGAVVARGMSVRHPDAIVENVHIEGTLQYGFWTRESTTPGGAGARVRANNITVKNQHYYTLGGSQAFYIGGDDGVLTNLLVDGVDDYGITVYGKRNYVELSAERVGMQGGDVAGNWPVGRFAQPADGNVVVLKRVRNGATGAAWGADSGTTTNNRVTIQDIESTTPVGSTTWLRSSAGYGDAPVAKAAAITSPTADVTALKTAVDALRTAVKNYGITA